MKYEICIFDLDGTLTDPKIGITKSFQYALTEFGIHEELDSLARFIGPSLRECFQNSYGFSDADTEKAVAKFREYFAETGIFENTVYPGIPAALQTLKDSGKILAVATNKVTEYACQILEHFDLDGYFSFVSGDKMDGSLSKIGKQVVIRIALDALDLNREKAAVMIGDRELDMIGAREAGIDSIGVTYGYGSKTELKNSGAVVTVDSVEQCVQLLQS